MNIVMNKRLLMALLASMLSACKPVATAPAASLMLGEQVFQRCLTCHSANDENRPTGPNLHQLLGRKAATREGYFYSEPLRNSNLTWDRATLDAYLANPQRLVPDSFMLLATPDAAERAAVLDHLLTLQ